MSLPSKVKVIFVLVVIAFIVISCDAKKKKKLKKSAKGMILRQKETNPINFIRLAAMRLIYGLATRIGLGEQISDALGGAFVPPGVDDYDDYEKDEIICWRRRYLIKGNIYYMDETWLNKGYTVGITWQDTLGERLLAMGTRTSEGLIWRGNIFEMCISQFVLYCISVIVMHYEST